MASEDVRPKNMFNLCMNEMNNTTQVNETANSDPDGEIRLYLNEFYKKFKEVGGYTTVIEFWNEIKGDNMTINLRSKPENLISDVKLYLNEDAISLPFSKNSCFSHCIQNRCDDIFSIVFEVVIGREAFQYDFEINPKKETSITFPVSLPVETYLLDPDYKVGDIITLTKNRAGKICYIGRLEHKEDKENYYGIDLLFGSGKGDGTRQGVQYFQSTHADSGAFVKIGSIQGLGINLEEPDLNDVKRMKGVSHCDMHGLMAHENWHAPIEVVTCEEENRPGYDSMPSHEYNDDPRTMKEKIKVFAQLLLQSKHCMAYTGAGISTSSGINDYASKAKNSKMKEAQKKKKTVKKKGRTCLPTLGHRVLVELYRHGWLKHWVQQNHDGLPQKAGYPHHKINEIHGSWWDISNPVCPMSGTLRSDLWDWMEEWQEKTDLTITLGTSLCGMSADDCVNNVSLRYADIDEENVLGSIIVGLQRTPLDHICSLRLYGTIDEVVALLAEELKITIPPYKTFVPDIPSKALVKKDVYKVPYNKKGKLSTNPNEWIVWDLSRGAKVKCVSGPGKGFSGQMVGFYMGTNHYAIATKKMREGHKDHGKRKATYYIGSWMVEAAVHGRMGFLPVVNKLEDLQMQKGLEQN